MNAMERIGEIEKLSDTGQWPIEHVDGLFLLRAFKVMREIAVESIDDELTGSQSRAKIAETSVDDIFEERMSK